MHLGRGIFCHLSVRHGHVNFSILDPASLSAPQHQEASFYCRKELHFPDIKKQLTVQLLSPFLTLDAACFSQSVQKFFFFYKPVTSFTILNMNNVNYEEKSHHCKNSESVSNCLPVLKSKGRLVMIRSCRSSSTNSQRRRNAQTHAEMFYDADAFRVGGYF